MPEKAISVKKIRIAPISSKAARAFVRAWHYSGKTTQNSQLHFGAFYDGRLHGVMQFGPPIDKRKIIGLVDGTGWSQFLELNRMAFDDFLPKNSESRSLSIAFRLIRKHYPHIKWIISFADACQCGDGAIYRGAGFLLTQVKRNTTMLKLPDGSIVANKTLSNHPVKNTAYWKKRGAKALRGYQIRYIYFLDSAWRDRLAVPVLPYSAIEEVGAVMYKGKRAKQATDVSSVPATGQNRSARSKQAAA